MPGVNCLFQSKAIQLAVHFRELEIDTPVEELPETGFHSNQGDGEALRLV